MKKILSDAEVANIEKVKKTKNQVVDNQKEILKKLDEQPKQQANTMSKTDAVAKVAYDKADAALKVATNQSDLVVQMTKAIEALKTDKQIKGYSMKINRNAEGFMQSIDVEIR